MGKGRRYDDTPKLNIKKVMATIIAILVFGMFCFSLKNLLTKSEKQVQDFSAMTTYFSIYENSKWGVIDQKGDIIISPTNEEMIIIPDENKDLFVCTYDINYDKETYKTKVLNSKGEEILSKYNNIQVLQNTDGVNIWYEKDILMFSENEKYGLIDFDGRQIIPAEYDDIYVLEGIEKNIIIEKDGKKGLVLSSTGEIIINPDYTEITTLTDNYENGYIVKNEEDKYGIISIDKKVIFESQYDEIKKVFGNGYYVVKKEGKLLVVNSKEEVKLEKGFDSVEKIEGNNLFIIKDDKYGVISIEGKEIIPADYEDLKPAISDFYYIAKKDGKYGIITSENSTKIEFEYESMDYIKTANFIEAGREDYTTDVFDSNLKKVLEKVYISEINLKDGYLRIRKGEDYKYYNFKFEEKAGTEVLNSHTLFLFKQNGKYGYKNKAGEIIVDPIYDDAKEQNAFGYCAIKKGNLWGALKSDGTIILAPSINLDQYLYINFIDKWHMSNDLNLNTYIK